MAGVCWADDLAGADQASLSDCSKIPILGELKLIKSLVMLDLT